MHVTTHQGTACNALSANQACRGCASYPEQSNVLSALCGEQVIYPLGTADAIAKEGLGSEVTEASRLALEQRLDELMEAVRLSYLVTREGGWGAQTEWGETLSLGMCLP